MRSARVSGIQQLDGFPCLGTLTVCLNRKKVSKVTGSIDAGECVIERVGAMNLIKREVIFVQKGKLYLYIFLLIYRSSFYAKKKDINNAISCPHEGYINPRHRIESRPSQRTHTSEATKSKLSLHAVKFNSRFDLDTD